MTNDKQNSPHKRLVNKCSMLIQRHKQSMLAQCIVRVKYIPSFQLLAPKGYQRAMLNPLGHHMSKTTSPCQIRLAFKRNTLSIMFSALIFVFLPLRGPTPGDCLHLLEDSPPFSNPTCRSCSLRSCFSPVGRSVFSSKPVSNAGSPARNFSRMPSMPAEGV